MTDAKFATSPAELLSVSTLAQISGFDFIDGIRSGRYPHPPIAETLGFRMTEVEEGRVVFEGTPSFAAYNPLGGVHGLRGANNVACRAGLYHCGV